MRTYCHPGKLTIDSSWKVREFLLPLPGKGKNDDVPEKKFPRISVIGNTSSGKTTLIRQLLGINPDMKKEEFLGITDSRSTVSNYEIIVDQYAKDYKAVISFYDENRIDSTVDEILKSVVLNGITFEISKEKLKELLNINIDENPKNENDKRENEKKTAIVETLSTIEADTKEKIKEIIQEILSTFLNKDIEEISEEILKNGSYKNLTEEYNKYLNDKEKNYEIIIKILRKLLKSKNQNDRFDVTLGDPNWFRPRKKPLSDDILEKRKVLEELLEKFFEFYQKFHEENIEWSESEHVNEFREYYLDLIKDRFNYILRKEEIAPYIDFLTYEDIEECEGNYNNLPCPSNFSNQNPDIYEIDIKEEWLSAITIRIEDKETFKKILEIFTTLNKKSFGEALTSFVEGIRFRGKFTPDWLDENYSNPYNMVILDGEGAGQDISNPLPTHISEKFSISDLIILADKSNPSFTQGTTSIIRKIVMSGFSDNLIMVFSKLDQMQTEHISDRENIIWDAANGLESIKLDEYREISETDKINLRKIYEGENKRGFVFYKLNKKINNITPDEYLDEEYDEEYLQDEMKKRFNDLIQRIWQLAYDKKPPRQASIKYQNFYDYFKNFIENDLDRVKYNFIEEISSPTHWATVKAFTRRVAERWNNCKHTDNKGRLYDPLGIIIDKFQEAIRKYLTDNLLIIGGNQQAKDETVNEIMKQGFDISVNDSLIREFLVRNRKNEWFDAYNQRGRGSNARRIEIIEDIFDMAFEDFLEEIELIKNNLELNLSNINKANDCENINNSIITCKSDKALGL